ncbi:MAG: hypothetical protein COU42_02890 [Candidatus Nealsonbacteria bacterium CG10_big_fil_rev_8_21_14_0_10_36_24]|uniref:Serine protease n=2 Tax=Candidatus Nealsoniibacteriota TaxID=1817911 RepID=A0A2H0YN92_9BACT|nr:MAG: hypothetical protein COU42_02890 [Candidatus Nealsonbacteria bacterium CG10_big_fil_rev_8_21_14_0_10_36_24]PIS39971.1 MAG: hypothetical protein COT32_02230 [Candidatus Nealsonbacteria bacterium CG08_land_8_20_14_0_20_36_22]
MLKNILKILIIFLFGMAGGIFAGQILWPYYIERPLAPVIEKKEIIIQENTVLQEAVKKVEKSVVGIRIKTAGGKIITGSGIIVTTDGLIVTLSELLPKAGDFAFFIDGKTVVEYQILKRDQKTNLVLLKVKAEKDDLQTSGFAPFEEIKLGERVFLMGVIFPESEPIKMVNEGIVKYLTEDYIRTNIFENNTLTGSPLFNIKGELLGLNIIDSQGRVTAIPITQIRQFIGL